MSRISILFLLLISISIHIYSQNTLTNIKERGVLNVGVLDKDAKPFLYRSSSGEWTGFEIIRAKDIAGKLGVDISITPYRDVDNAKSALNSGSIDIFFHKRFKTLSDGLDTLISKPLASMEMVLVVNRREFAALKQHPDLKKSFLDGSIPVSTRGEESFWGSFYKGFYPLKIDNTYDEESLWTYVISGSEIAIYEDEATVKELFNNRPELGIELSYLPLGITQEVVALISWKESFFLDWINIAIEGWGEPKSMMEVTKISKGESNE